MLFSAVEPSFSAAERKVVYDRGCGENARTLGGGLDRPSSLLRPNRRVRSNSLAVNDPCARILCQPARPQLGNGVLNGRSSSPIDINSLDFLRGLAAIYVVIHHVRGSFFIGGERILSEVGWSGLTVTDYIGISLLQLTSLGPEFVVLFFVISGFAMANSVQLSGDTTRFYKRRIIRLWPTYLLAAAIAVVLCGYELLTAPSAEIVVRCGSKCTWSSFSAFALYINVDFPHVPQFWSLQYEVLFYAICPFVLRTSRRVLLTLGASWVAGGFGAFIYGIDLLPAGSTIVNFVLFTMLFFSSGAALYHFNNWVPKVSLSVFLLTTFGSLLTIVVLKFVMHGSNLILSIWMVALTCFAIINLPTYGLALKRLSAGSWSYSIYLFHYQLIIIFTFVLLDVFDITASNIRGYLWWMLAVPPVLFGCWILYFISERPCNAVLRRMRSHDRSGPTKDQMIEREPTLVEVGQPGA
jgi:peptidoglycan/LPS O-acetylase OafA/YrhL